MGCHLSDADGKEDGAVAVPVALEDGVLTAEEASSLHGLGWQNGAPCYWKQLVGVWSLFSGVSIVLRLEPVCTVTGTAFQLLFLNNVWCVRPPRVQDVANKLNHMAENLCIHKRDANRKE